MEALIHLPSPHKHYIQSSIYPRFQSSRHSNYSSYESTVSAQSQPTCFTRIWRKTCEDVVFPAQITFHSSRVIQHSKNRLESFQITISKFNLVHGLDIGLCFFYPNLLQLKRALEAPSPHTVDMHIKIWKEFPYPLFILAMLLHRELHRSCNSTKD